METGRLVSQLRAVFKHYTVTAPGIDLVLALWVVNSYLWQQFDFCPYLFITSPVKRCGKTTVLELLNYLSNSPLFTSAITPAALSRSVEARSPTLLIDEAEHLSTEIRTILNAGFKRGGAVLKCVGPKVRKINVYGPKAIAAITKLPETVLDRSIVIKMRRKQPNEAIKSLRERALRSLTKRLSHKVERWANSHQDEVKKVYQNTTIDFLHDREADIWEPLIAIASVAAPASLNELRGCVLRLSAEKAKSQTDDCEALQLLGHIRLVFRKKALGGKKIKISTEDLLAGLKSLGEGRWVGLNSIELATLLRPFDIEPKQLWVDGKNVRGYKVRDFRAAFGAYLKPEKVA